MPGRSSPRCQLEVGILIDSLTTMMLVVVTTVSMLVQIYSLGYMHGDPRFSRYYAYLSLFTFSMLGLVLANNFFLIFIFWELVGLTSYLLIGFWFEKKSASDAGKKAFITTRIGDLGFIVGILLLSILCRHSELSGSFRAGSRGCNSDGGAFTGGSLHLLRRGRQVGAVPAACLAAGRDGRSDAGFGIDSCRDDGCGRCLSGRALDGDLCPRSDAGMVVAVIGIITSLLAASIALVQNDIKRILAYSTVSQLGYMIMALGLGSFTAGTLHLMTHAFFKALLFLCAGSVIHAVHTQDIQFMGGLEEQDEDHVLGDVDCLAVDCRYTATVGILV